MDSGDIIFYVVIAISVVGSISKAFKKKADVEMDELPPQSGAEIFRKIVQEMQRGDDFIPANPKPAVAKVQARNVEQSYVMPEVDRRQQSHSTNISKNSILEPIEDEEDELISSMNLTDADEFRKAFVYSEILKTKF